MSKNRLHLLFGNLSLAQKLTFLATVTACVSMILLCAIVGAYDTSTMRARLVDDTGILATVVGTNSTGAFAFRDAAAAQETLNALASNPQVQMAAFVLADGTILARYHRAGARQPDPTFDLATVIDGHAWHNFEDATLVVATPVRLKGRVVGAMYVELSLAELRARTATLWRTLALALVLTVILAGILAARLQRIISAPLLRLTRITRIVTSQRNYGIRAVSEGGDEVGELVNGFNEMLEHIQQRDSILEQHRQTLERTVEARTAELKANMERFKVLVESTSTIPWEIDTNGYTFSYVSPQVTRLLGYEPEAVCGRLTLWDLAHPDDQARVQAQLVGLSTAEATLDFDCRLVAEDQRVIDVRSVIRSHAKGDVTDGSRVLRGITIDVTRQKKLELELRQAQKLESVGRLASGVAHEINTPVQFVSDSIRFVQEALSDLCGVLNKYRDGAPDAAQAEEDADLPYLLEQMPKALDRALEGLNRVAVIVRSMKEFAHPDRKEMSPCDLNQAITSTLTIAHNEFKYVADVETDFGDLPLVTCHGGDINQVVLNIVVNAAHAIGDVVQNGGSKGLIRIQTRQAGESVLIRISDTGGGIPEAIQGRIFDPFFTTKEVGKGTGQGLAIAHSVIVEKHGGDLSFETQSGQGTTFNIRIPVAGTNTTSGVAA